MKTSLQTYHAGDNQALNEQRQLLLMFRQQVGNPSTEVRRLGMSDEEFAVDDAVHIQLAFDAGRFIRSERKVCGEAKPFFGDIHHLANGCGFLVRHKTTSSNRYAKLVALVLHQLNPSADSDEVITILPRGSALTSDRLVSQRRELERGRD